MDHAARDLRNQLNFITADNPEASKVVRQRLLAAAAKLGEIPTGRPGRVTGTYEKSVTGLPYIIAYRISAEHGQEIVEILRVIHTSRDWQPGSWPN